VLVPSAIAAAPAYHRHRPEQTALYAIVAEHYPRFLQEIESVDNFVAAVERADWRRFPSARR
jgi:hypothetical protein